MFGIGKKISMPDPADALPGRDQAIPIPAQHFVNGHAMSPPYPEHMVSAMFGLGCFWGAEKRFWETSRVYLTAVGYAGGYTPNPTYQEVCSGLTGHNEVVLVIFEPAVVGYDALLKCFWEAHDPTQGMRQGNDMGTQYRSGIYCANDEQVKLAEQSKLHFQQALSSAGYGEITTEIMLAPTFYYAEEYHQQYLAKNPAGYCGLGGIGVSYPVD